MLRFAVRVIPFVSCFGCTQTHQHLPKTPQFWASFRPPSLSERDIYGPRMNALLMTWRVLLLDLAFRNVQLNVTILKVIKQFSHVCAILVPPKKKKIVPCWRKSSTQPCACAIHCHDTFPKAKMWWHLRLNGLISVLSSSILGTDVARLTGFTDRKLSLLDKFQLMLTRSRTESHRLHCLNSCQLTCERNKVYYSLM